MGRFWQRLVLWLDAKRGRLTELVDWNLKAGLGSRSELQKYPHGGLTSLKVSEAMRALTAEERKKVKV
jgi:hypothetical protein